MAQELNFFPAYIDDLLRMLSILGACNLPKWDTISLGYDQDKPQWLDQVHIKE